MKKIKIKPWNYIREQNGIYVCKLCDKIMTNYRSVNFHVLNHFYTGDNNPAKRPEVRKKISKNNPSHRPEVREKQRVSRNKWLKKNPWFPLYLSILYSITRVGTGNPMYGKKWTKEQKQKLSEIITKTYKNNPHLLEIRSKNAKKMWENSEYSKKILSILSSRPTKLEQSFINFFKKHNIPFSYCGNGSLVIGGKCPDFMESSGKKKIIEVSDVEVVKVFRKMTKKQYEQQRILHFRKYGWECLVLWQYELEKEKTLLAKINNFMTGV